jgi:hypothetical protein
VSGVAGSDVGDVVDSESRASSSLLEPVGGLTVEDECCGSSADVDPEELEDVSDRSGDFAESDVAPEGAAAPGLFIEFAPVAGPESVDPVFVDEASEDAD